MKQIRKRSQLATNDQVWNVMLEVLAEGDADHSGLLFREAKTVVDFYNEVESGGHEGFLNWKQEEIEEVGSVHYFNELAQVLYKIGALEYAKLELEMGPKIWSLFVQLEKTYTEEKEEVFYQAITMADNQYEQLHDKISEYLEAYFLDIHTQIIDVVEDE
ncbi:hypothetical protein [Alkalihalobacillus pseudalcaliphilus]|uniref:hypothetical protein n=1 Tax=Alkalihalobacillus pseudalcaliphilus TaxID=79884 RepID=UPI000AA995E2|nr:hypothetical protein [Alkalihalobacillus pseudalcaliphilus]